MGHRILGPLSKDATGPYGTSVDFISERTVRFGRTWSAAHVSTREFEN